MNAINPYLHVLHALHNTIYSRNRFVSFFGWATLATFILMFNAIFVLGLILLATEVHNRREVGVALATGLAALNVIFLVQLTGEE